MKVLRIAAWGVALAGLASCSVGTTHGAPQSQPSAAKGNAAAPHSYDPARPFDERPQSNSRIQTAEPARRAGLESGFTHCCGDVDYAMQVDCSDRLMRCYENDSAAGWQQTYGRNCKEALGQGCYEQGCLAVCE